MQTQPLSSQVSSLGSPVTGPVGSSAGASINPSTSASGASLSEDSRQGASVGLEEQIARKGRISAGMIVFVLGALGLAAWLGVRIEGAKKQQAVMAAEREQVAREARSRPAHSAQATVQPVADEWLPVVAVDGTLAAVQESDLGFKTPGRLVSIRVRVGDRVGRGQVLASLESAEAGAQVQAAEAQVKVAEVQLSLASDSERRTSSLVGSGASAQANGVQVAQQKALAEAQLEAARAQLSLARASFANYTLSAPFAGTITKVPSGAGAVVNPGAPLFHLQDTSRLKLVATVGEGDAPLVRKASVITVRTNGRELVGKIVSVLGSVDAMTRRVPVEAEIANSSGDPLLAGIFVRGTAGAGERVAVLKLPASALRPGSQDEIMVVSKGKLQERHVVFATGTDGAMMIRSGLDAGEEVIAAPSAEAKEGDAL